MSSPSAYYTAGECLPARGAGCKLAIRPTSNLSIQRGQLLVCETTANATEVQSVSTSGSPTGGTFALDFNGSVTAPIPFNATAAQVQSALQALPNIGTSGVVCTGGALGTAAVTVTFSGDLAGLPQNLLTTANVALTGGSSPAAAITRTTAGVGYARFKAYTGTGTPVISQYDFRTDERGRISRGQSLTPQFGFDPDTPAWIGGIFRSGDLVGLDAAAVTTLGARWFNGTLSDSNALLIIPGAN